MNLDGANAVTAWRANNDSSIELTASGTGAATNLLYVAAELNGNGGIKVNDFSGDTLALAGTLGDIDLVESTIFWLGYYAPERDGSTGDGFGQYAYNYYNGSSYISHQSDDGIVEHYSPTRAGDAIDALEGEYQVWTSVTYGASPGTSMYVNGADLNVAPHDGIASAAAADTFQMFRYSSSGYNFVGNMHECIIYDGALSAADIAAVEAYLDAKRAPYAGLPEVSSGALAVHFVADPSTMDVDPSNNAVTAWRASNNPSIELTASGIGAATNLLYDAGDLHGHGGIQVNDFSGETMGLEGSIGDLDLVESTIFWLGYYAPERDGSTGDGSGQYAYNYYNGSSYISHQSDDGIVEHYSPTRAGDAIDALEGEYQVWTSVTYGAAPGTSMYVNGVDLNVAPHDGIASAAAADTFQMFRYSSSGYNFVGNMHECIIYEGALSAADIAVIEAYLDAKRTPPGPGTAYCFGDGSGTACPCGNAGGGSAGCANSTGAGGTLTASGDPSLSSDTLVLEADGLVAGLPCLFFSGANRVNGGAGIVFGDGLRCAGFEAVRVEVTASGTGGAASSSVEVSTNGQAYGHTLTAGETVNYQCWYRDDVSSSPCSNSFNATNGYSVVWSS
jgi:predicted RNA-binding protein